MLRRIRFKPLLALNRAVNFVRRKGALFQDSVGYDRRDRPVKKVKDPVIHALQARPEFVDAIPHTATGKILKTALRDQFKAYKFPNAAA